MTDWTGLRKSLLKDSKSMLPPTVKLPMLPRALTEFTEKAKDPEANPAELSAIIATDSGLSSALLRQVNSAAVGARSTITSVQQALTMFGIRATQLYLTTSGLKQMMKSTASKLINIQNFWNTNLERAIMAREVAKLIKADSGLAFTAGMLQDFLLPLITNELYDEYVQYTEEPEKFGSLAAFERQKFGWDHAQAGAQVMLNWNFPDELICCVCLHHRGLVMLNDDQLKRTSALAVTVSSLVPDPVQQEPKGMSQLIKLDERWGAFELLSLAETIDEEFQATTSDSNHLSFLRTCKKSIERAAAGES